MGMGGPGDNDFMDVVKFELEVYGEPADSLLRELEKVVSRQEPYKWWQENIGWQCTKPDALKIITAKHDLEISKNNG
jgi:hypothetical protein